VNSSIVNPNIATLGFTMRPLTANLQKTTDGVELFPVILSWTGY